MRVAIWLDGNNFYAGWRLTAAGSRIDFGDLARWITHQAGGSELTGAWYYTGVDGEAEESKAVASRARLGGFLTMLEHVPGFFVKRFPRVTRTSHCSSCGAEHTYSQEKGVDTNMVVDMIRLAANNAFDVMVLVTGDADHIPGVQAVREYGKRVLVCTWGGYGLSQRLRAESWGHLDLLEGLQAFSTPPVTLEVVERTESDETLDSDTEPETEDVGDPASSPGMHAAFLSELERAERHFDSGYVGLALFLHRWMTQQDLPHWMRPTILDVLVAQGKVEVYETGDGKMALRRAS
jgi:uncharacterized LabA/DUF88 family protein